MTERSSDTAISINCTTKKVRCDVEESDSESNISSNYDGEDEYQRQVTKYYSQMFEKDQDIISITITDTDKESDIISISSDESGIQPDCSDDMIYPDFEYDEDDWYVSEATSAFDERGMTSVSVLDSDDIDKIDTAHSSSVSLVNTEIESPIPTEEIQLRSTHLAHSATFLPGECVDVRGRIVRIDRPCHVPHGHSTLETQEIIIEDDYKENITLLLWKKNSSKYQHLLQVGEIITILNGKMGISLHNFAIYVTSYSTIKINTDGH
ncbi:hypothetical protein QAD02_013916 [Eretmocerus hayati]|uniref:Uncharacterized protein n=1 Tax=Eretmocerus hayati TaxID=131215 RepID=A0ACC2P3G3_9HYME|nr:hypothetical protein QAD02_013916 [Eretmocerus hayati]